MQFIKLLQVISFFVASIVTTSFAQVPQVHDPLVALLSPSLSQQDRADFFNSLEHLCMEKLGPGDRVLVYDGATLRPIAGVTLLAKDKNPRVKIKDCTPLWQGVANFLKPADDGKSIKTPEFLLNLMQAFPGTKPRILIVGSPIYSDKGGKYDMSKGWLSDGYLNASSSDSIFSVSGKSNLLAGSKVYFCYLSDDFFDPTNDKEKHKSKIVSFWGKYVSGLGGKLVIFQPNLKDVLPLWSSCSDGEVQHETIDPADQNLTINIPSKPVPNYFQQTIILPSDVLFSSGSAEMKSAATPALSELAQKMNLNKTLKFRIDGYTDSHGSTEMNQKLSLKRAEAVKNWLVANGGIDASRLQTVGCGKSNPKVPAGISAEEAPNRRVEITAVK